MLLDRGKTFLKYWGQMFKFYTVNWFKSDESAERPTETIRRTGIGKEVFEQLQKSTDLIVSLSSRTTSADLSPYQKRVLDSYARILEAGRRSEPYKYRKVTKGITFTVLAIAGYYALTPRWLQEHLSFLPPLDFFPPFTFMQRSLGSGITARFLWTLYGTVAGCFPVSQPLFFVKNDCKDGKEICGYPP